MPAPQPAIATIELAVAQRLARLLQGPARAQVGDILTVKVNITDKANIANTT